MNPLLLLMMLGNKSGGFANKLLPMMINPAMGMLGLITNKRVGMTDLFLGMMNPMLGIFSMISKPPIRRRRYRRPYYPRRRYYRRK